MDLDIAEAASTLPKDQARFYIARHDGRAVGVVHLSPSVVDALVQHIYVVPDYRRRGVAAALLAHAQRSVGLPLVHDDQTSDAGERLLVAQGVRALYPERDPLPDDTAEATGAKLLRSLTGPKTEA